MGGGRVSPSSSSLSVSVGREAVEREVEGVSQVGVESEG